MVVWRLRQTGAPHCSVLHVHAPGLHIRFPDTYAYLTTHTSQCIPHKYACLASQVRMS